MSSPGRGQLGLFRPGELQSPETHAVIRDFRRVGLELYRMRGELDDLAERNTFPAGNAFAYLALLIFQPKREGSIQESRSRLANFFRVDVRTFDRWRDALVERGYIKHFPIVRPVAAITKARRKPIQSFVAGHDSGDREHENANCCSVDYATDKARRLFSGLLLIPGSRGVRKLRGRWNSLWKTLQYQLRRFAPSPRGEMPPHTKGFFSKDVGSADFDRGSGTELVEKAQSPPRLRVVSAVADGFWEADRYERAKRGLPNALPLGSIRWRGLEGLRKRWLRIRYIRILGLRYAPRRVI